ncbi:hypothetical protein [Nostoc sp.]
MSTTGYAHAPPQPINKSSNFQVNTPRIRGIFIHAHLLVYGSIK